METLDGTPGASRGRLVRRLGEAGYGRDSGIVGTLDLLARAGLPIPEGAVLTAEAHRVFMEASGIGRAIRAAARSEGDARLRAADLRRRYLSTPLEGELNRTICDASIGLDARTVTVLSEGATVSGLRSIPRVKDAIRDVWLSSIGLERQVKAAIRGQEIPAWPVLVQREISPQVTGWSAAEYSLGERSRMARPKNTEVNTRAALYDVTPTPGAQSHDWRSIDEFTLEAGYLLGEPVRLQWGLAAGRWYVLSVDLHSRDDR